MQNQDDTITKVAANISVSVDDVEISVVHPLENSEEQRPDELERIEVAMRCSRSGNWTFDFSKKTLIVCKRCRELIPLLNEENLSLKRILNLIAPDFRIKVIEVFLIASKSTKSFDIEVPVNLLTDNEPIWFRLTGLNTYGISGTSPVMLGMIEDVSARKRSEQLRQDVIAIVSHDLRSPLSIIKLYVQLCEQKVGIYDKGTMCEMLSKANEQINKMNCLIESYLELPATGVWELDFVLQWFDFKELLNEVIADIRLLYPLYRIVIKPKEEVKVIADREKISQVLHNLLSNAIKYSSRKDVISIDFRTIENALQVAIEDCGIGIEKADQFKIFDRFYRAQNMADKTVKGHGIGLYLSKYIIKQHKGDIWLKSDHNKGTKVYFTLPLTSQ